MDLQSVNVFDSEIKKMTQSQADESLKEDEANKFSMMIPCSFLEISDVTTIHMGKYNDSIKYSRKAAMFPIKKPDCKCFFNESTPTSATVYSSGGTKYIIPVPLKILKIFPLEEGLLFQCEYNKNAIKFSLENFMEETRSKSSSFAYLTLDCHPLNDLRPLSEFVKEKIATQDANPYRFFWRHFIDTSVDVLCVSRDFPLLIYYDTITSELAINLIRLTYQTEEYLESLKHESHHKFLPNISSKSFFSTECIYRLPLSQKPKQVKISNGMGVNTISIYAIIGETQLNIFDWDISKPYLNNYSSVTTIPVSPNPITISPAFKPPKCFDNIISIEVLEDTSRSDFECLPVLCNPSNIKTTTNKKDQNDEDDRWKFIERLKTFRKILVGLDKNGLILHLMKGSYNVLDINLLGVQMEILGENIFASGSEVLKEGAISIKATKILDSKDLRLTLAIDKMENMSFTAQKMHQVRIALNSIASPASTLIFSILQSIQAILPESVYAKFYTDYLSLQYKSCDIPSSASGPVDKTELLSEMEAIKILIFTLAQRKRTPTIYETPSKKKKKETSEVQAASVENAWEELMKSEFHQTMSNDFDDLFGNSLDEVAKSSNTAKGSRDDKTLMKIEYNASVLQSEPTEFLQYIDQIVKLLHLLYEDMKLLKCLNNNLEPLSELLFQICINLSCNSATLLGTLEYSAYIEYYMRDFPEILNRNIQLYNVYYEKCLKKLGESIDLSGFRPSIPPDIFHWIHMKLTKLNAIETSDANIYPIYFEQTRIVCKIFEVMMSSPNDKMIAFQLHYLNEVQPDKSSQPTLMTDTVESSPSGHAMVTEEKEATKVEKILSVLLEEGIQSEDILNTWPFSISGIIYELIWSSREHPQKIKTSKWQGKMYQLIGREDIALNLRIEERNTSNGNANKKERLSLGGKEQHFSGGAKRIDEYFTGVEIFKELLPDGDFSRRSGKSKNLMNPSSGSNAKSAYAANNTNIADYRFTVDARYKEVANLLSSSKAIKLRTHLIPESERGSEEKFEAAKQQLLYKMAIRQLSKCVGRGALTYGTLMALPSETLDIPKICLSGRMPPKDTKIAFEIKDEAKEKELLSWPEFHNGVAAGLRLAKERNRKSSNTRNWILYQKPHVPKYEHGGFLLAMGLLGDLDCLLSTDIYQYLKSAHEATTIGILLGSAASKLGSMDDALSRTLCLHIPFLLPPTFEIEISMPIQSAAILGAGLVYLGTSHRLMTEMILSQIGRKPYSDKCMDREVYALCAGFALGFVNINYKENAIGLSDLQLDERLIRFIEGGKVMDPPLSMLSANINAESNKCSSVLEGDNVNIHITAPGALMALAIIHMQTNNENIAKRLEIPNSFYALEQAKPFHNYSSTGLLLKILTKDLIMWNSIECTTEWIYSNIPLFIRQIFESPLKVVEAKYVGTLIADEEIDYSAIALCYVSILAGAILALGLRFAGSNNKDAMLVVCKEIDKLRSLTTTNLKAQNYVNYNDQNKNHIDKYTLDNCLCVCAFSISMIMAGSGDVDCFRNLRVLRKHLEKDMHYGHNLALNMCMGFLFLGSGAYTFGTSKLAVAALLCSVYPYFATGTTGPSDNKYYLQAMRHFYVLALQTRLLQAKDVDSGENVQVHIQLNYSKEKLQVTTPAIVNQMEKVISVVVKDPKYYEIEIPACNQWVVYVKKRMYALNMMESESKTKDSANATVLSPFSKQSSYTHIRKKLLVSSFSDEKVLTPAYWKTLTDNPIILFYLEKLCSQWPSQILIQSLESAFVSREILKHAPRNYIMNSLEEVLPIHYQGAHLDSVKAMEELELEMKMKMKDKIKLLGFILDCFAEGKLEILPMCWWLQCSIGNSLKKMRPTAIKEIKIIWYYFTKLKNVLEGKKVLAAADSSAAESDGSSNDLLSKLFLSEVKNSIENEMCLGADEKVNYSPVLSAYSLASASQKEFQAKFFQFNQFATYFDLPFGVSIKQMEAKVAGCIQRILGGSIEKTTMDEIIADWKKLLHSEFSELYSSATGSKLAACDPRATYMEGSKLSKAAVKYKESEILAYETLKVLHAAFPQVNHGILCGLAVKLSM